MKKARTFDVYPRRKSALVLDLSFKRNEMCKEELLQSAIVCDKLLHAASSCVYSVRKPDSSQSQHSPGSRFAPQQGQV